MKAIFVGAHPDDIEIYCGGTIMKLQEKKVDIIYIICTDGYIKDGNRILEAEKAINELKIKKYYCLGFDDGQLEHNINLIRELDDIFKKENPDIIFCHSPKDYHQDHIAVAKCVRSANRLYDSSLISYSYHNYYESFDANLFIDISKYFKRKEKLLNIFKSQKDNWYFKLHNNVENFKIEVAKW